ncbi:hypothetical protein KJ762_00970 [bacterium]|nr:hypothetical protein [bacterium]MBU1633061.1 hypothetical protein [bacterium]MBU1872967.1 hypothetical protein [bacterium]
MAILYSSKCRDRRQILESFYPFTKPAVIEGLIIGNDLDALLSAALLKQRYGWDVVAVYDYRKLWVDQRIADNVIQKLKSGVYLAVDLDIYRNAVPSIGHHILQLTEKDRLEQHEQTLNPNLIFGVDCRNFRAKYPLGTIHFLRWLFEMELDRRGELLCWLADSAYINAQSHRFRENVSHWLYEFFDWPPFWEIFILLDSADYEELLVREIGRTLDKILITPRPGQVKSRHKSLNGWQCQWSDPGTQGEQIRQIFAFIHELSGWRIPELPKFYSCITGQRKRISVAELLKDYGSLDEFLNREHVFSYAFTHAQLLNYTQFSSSPAGKT